MKPFERDQYYDDLVRSVGAGELTLGQAVRKLRIDVAEMNQATFAKMTKVSERTLRNLENDTGNPTVATTRAVLKPFGLNLVIGRRSHHD